MFIFVVVFFTLLALTSREHFSNCASRHQIVLTKLGRSVLLSRGGDIRWYWCLLINAWMMAHLIDTHTHMGTHACWCFMPLQVYCVVYRAQLNPSYSHDMVLCPPQSGGLVALVLHGFAGWDIRFMIGGKYEDKRSSAAWLASKGAQTRGGGGGGE